MDCAAAELKNLLLTRSARDDLARLIAGVPPGAKKTVLLLAINQSID
jgi:hypothetical protein